MTTVERYQSAVLGDTINLDFYAYNNNALVDINQFHRVEIYFLDPTEITDSNIDGRTIKTIVLPSNITRIDEGHYRVVLEVSDTLFEVGNFIDVWKVKFNNYDEDFTPIENQFRVSTDLRETHDRPFIYDCDFSFSPKKITKGSKQYLKIGFRPTVHTDIGTGTIEQELFDRFYYNLKRTGNLFIKIEMIEGCGYNSEFPLMNIKTDPEWTPTDIRGDNEAYHLLDVTESQSDYDLGVYFIQFKVDIQGQEIISRKFYLQIYD